MFQSLSVDSGRHRVMLGPTLSHCTAVWGSLQMVTDASEWDQLVNVFLPWLHADKTICVMVTFDGKWFCLIHFRLNKGCV